MIDHCSNAGFVEWIEQEIGGSLFISVISIAKTEHGIWARFPELPESIPIVF